MRNRAVRVDARGGSRLVGLAVFFFCVAAAGAAEISANPENYLTRLKQLAPGDTLILAAGVYRNGLPIHFLNGGAGRPISIRGPSGEPHAVLVGNAYRNTVSIRDSSYVSISHLHLDGQGQPADAIKAEGHAQWAHHITLEDLVIRGHGHDQQTVAISSKCPAWGWVVRRNVIVGAGTGMYFGNSDGRAPFIGGLIEHNLIVDTLGYNLQIKHQSPRPDLPGMPRGKSATTIRHNVFSKARAGAAKEQARPNVLVGHWPLSGPGMDDQYLIYGNFFYQNPHESLFQGEGNIALYNNLFVNHFGDAVRIQPHHDTPRKVTVFYNTVVAAGVGIYLARRGGDAAYAQTITGNVIFAERPLASEYQHDNLIGAREVAAKYLVQPFAPLGELDLRRQTPYSRRSASDQSALSRYPEWDRDFDGARRDTLSAGAYGGGAGALHWVLRLEQKLRP